MENVRPAPGEELNTGPETVPRLAATVILLRGGDERLELLLVQRNPEARFMGGAWVFPGGAVSSADGEGEVALRRAASRELNEEAGVAVEADQLAAFSRWITPSAVKTRYDTWFFLAIAPDDAEPRIDGSEVVAARWFTPDGALDASRAGEILLVFPTIKHLEQLATFSTAEQLVEHARARTVEPVLPRVVGIGETARIVLPGEQGYDD